MRRTSVCMPARCALCGEPAPPPGRFARTRHTRAVAAATASAARPRTTTTCCTHLRTLDTRRALENEPRLVAYRASFMLRELVGLHSRPARRMHHRAHGAPTFIYRCVSHTRPLLPSPSANTLHVRRGAFRARRQRCRLPSLRSCWAPRRCSAWQRRATHKRATLSAG